MKDCEVQMYEDKTPKRTLGQNSIANHFRDEMDSLVSRFFGGGAPFAPFPTAAQSTGFPSLDMTGAISPAIDIHETDDALELTAELPGMGEDDVEVELRDWSLILRGKKNVSYDGGGDLHVSERSYGSFKRTLPIPANVDLDKITAEFDKGVLHIVMPKAADEEPGHKIKISTR